MRTSLSALVAAGMVAYLLMVLGNAEYLHRMGGAGVARNAPVIVYMMSSGQLFMLLFAWAWVFAQVVLRDRAAQLHEMVLAAPLSLPALLLGRYLGAVALAALLGFAHILGFALAPLLQWAGLLPAGSIAATPWAAMLHGWLLFIVPCAFGFGALYVLAALRTRSLAGPFAVSAALMLCWVLSMVVFADQADDFWSRIVCPAGYTEVESQVNDWLPQQKSTAALEWTASLLLNRLLWGVVPLFALAWALWRLRGPQGREYMLREAASAKPRRSAPLPCAAALPAPALPMPPNWWQAARAEIRWQCRAVLHQRALGFTLLGLTLLYVAGGFNHIVGHAEGPLLPRTGLVVPLMRHMSFFFIVFVLAGWSGLCMRRDDSAGLGDMLDACPAPESVRWLARTAAIVTLAALLALVPAAASLLTAALGAPHSLDAALALGHALLVTLPALLEFAAVMVLMHALIRPAGAAYAASMLVAFIFLVNHEGELVTYPPAQLGIAMHVGYSDLLDWRAALAQTLGMAVWKLCIALLLLALAGWVMPRGCDAWSVTLRRNLRPRLLASPVGALSLAALLALAGLAPWLHRQLVDVGGWRSAASQRLEDAQWERRWARHAAAFHMSAGTLDITLHPARQRGSGHWQLRGVQSANAQLHMALPHGLAGLQAQVAGQPAAVEAAHDHAAIALGPCARTPAGCDVWLQWTLQSDHWNSEAVPAWMSADGIWARASDMAPQLGFDRMRLLRAPADRQAQQLPAAIPDIPAAASRMAAAIAPPAAWQWRVRLGESVVMDSGSTGQALDFAAVWAPAAHTTQAHGFTVLHGAQHAATARSVAEDVAAMQQCVAQRSGAHLPVARIVQLPRGLGRSALLGSTLLLPEQYAWDVADHGTGHWLRRADVAAALLRQHLHTLGQLTASAGAPVLDEGLAGALGLLCASASAPQAATRAALKYRTDNAIQALAASPIPLGPARAVPADGWYAAWGPLALRPWAATLAGTDYHALLAALQQHRGDALAALHSAFPQQRAWLLDTVPAADWHQRIEED